MSKNIDERVVEMRFDNDHFEKNVKETMSTLDKFKEKLNFTGATKGLNNIGDAAKKVDITPLATSAEKVRVKFSALEVMAVTALQNITNSAINAGKRIVSALTIDPVKTGFNEYELKMGSIQTIMAGSGEDLETVNKYLNELNEYSDKTIYSFAHMTQNIGKFTNAGVKLEDAVLAIKGISNEAAISGANANEASRAMYNFAQALSSGYVKLIDWKSIELANMATVDFKNQLIKTAVALGTVTDAGNGMYQTLEGNTFNATSKFNDVLQDQWMTSEVLIETLKKYADETTDIGKKATQAATEVKTFTQMLDTLKESAQSGWAQTWELLFGDFEEGKKLWTEINDVIGGIIGRAADARNSLLKGALSSKWSSLEEKITGLGINFDGFQEKLKETAREHNIAIDKMIETEGSLEATMKHGWLTSDLLTDTLGKYTDEVGATMDATEALSKSLEEFGDVVEQVIVGNFGNGEERVKLLTKAGYDYATIQNLVNQVLGATTDELKAQTDAQLKSLGLTEEQVKAIRSLAEESKKSGTEISDLLAQLDRPSGRELLIDTFRNALTGLGQVLSAVGRAWRNAFPPMTSEQLYKIIEAVHRLSERLVMNEGDVNKLTRTFKGLFAIIDVIATFTGGVFKAALKLIGRLLGLVDVPVLDLTAHIGDMLVGFRDWLFTNSIFAKGFNKLVDVIANGAKKVKDWFVHFVSLPETQARFERFKQSVTKGLSKFNTLLSKGKKIFVDFGKKLIDGAKNLKAWFDEWRALPGTEAKLQRLKTTFSNVLTTFGKLLQNGADKFKEFGKKIAEGAKKVKAWIDEFKSIPAVQTALNNLKSGATAVLTAIKNAFKTCKKPIDDFFARLKSLDSLTFEDIIDAVKELKNKIVRNFSKIGESFKAIPKALGTLSDEVKIKLGETWKGFDKFLEKIQYFVKSVKDRIGSIDLGGIILAALGIGTLTVGSKIGDALEALTAPLKGFGELLKGLATQTRTVGGLLKAVKFTVLAQGFTALAAGILILAGAAVLLTLVDQKKLWSAVGALGVLGVVLIGVSAAMAAINKGVSNIVANTTAIITLAGSVLILAIALRMISKMKTDALVNSLLVLGTVMAALLAVSIVLSKAAPKLFEGALSLVGFAVAVKILVSALKDITKINGNNIYDSLLVLVGIMASLALVTKMGKGIDKWGAISALAAAIALKILVGVIEDYSTMKLDTILSALVSILPILGMLALVMYSTKHAGQYAAKAGVAMLAISVALIFMVTAIKQLSKINPQSLVAPLAVVSVLMAVIAGVVAVSKFAGQHAMKAGAMLLMMAGALVIVALITAVLSKINPDGLYRGVAAITVLSGCFAALIFMTRYMKALKGAKTMLITLTVVVALLGIALVALSSLDTENVATAAIAMTAIMGMFTLLMKTVGTLKNLDKKALPTIAVLTLVVVALGGVLYLLGDLDPESALATAAGLSALLLSLSASCKILSTIKTFSGPALANAAILTLIVGALGGILYLLKDLNPESTLATAVGLSTLILALSGTCAILSVAGAAAQPALIGIGVLAALIVALGALMAGIGALVTEFPRINEWLDTAIPVLEKIGYGLGSFVGSIVGGLAAGVMSGLPAIATSISQFMTNLKPFFDGIKEVDSEMLSAAENIVAIVLLMTAANFINGISKFLLGGTDMTTFAVQLTALGAGIVGFSDIVKDRVDKDAVEAAANAGKMLTELANTVPNTGGLLGFIVGNNDIAYFAAQLPLLARALVDFSDVITGDDGNCLINKDSVQVAKDAGEMLTALADTVPNTGGLLGFITGNNDIGVFAAQLPLLARALVDFSDVITGDDGNCLINKDSVQVAKDAGEMLTALADTVPNTGGLLGFITGNNDIAGFGAQLPLLARALVDFSDVITDDNGKCLINKDSVQVAKDAGEMLTALADTVPNTGGLLGFITGHNDIGIFAVQLPLLARALVDFSDVITGDKGNCLINKDSIRVAKDAGEMLTALADTVPNTGGLLGFIVGNNDIGKFSAQLPLLGLGIASFAAIVTGKGADGQAVAKVDTSAVEAAANAGTILAGLTTKINLSSLGGLLSFIGTINAAAFLTQMPLLGQGIVAFSNKIVEGNVDKDTVEAAALAGEMLATLSTHVTESTGNWLYNLFGGNNNKFKNFKTQMKSLGEAIVEFAKAIDGKINESAVTAATRVGEILATLMEKMKAADISQMDKFNTKLSEFSDTILEFYTELTSINMLTLSNIMSNLNTAIDDMHRWVAAADTTKMSTFANRLSTLGTKIEGFYKDLKGIKLDTFTAALDVVERLVNLTMDMSEVNTDGVNAFGASLTSLGATGVTRFVGAFKDGESDIKTAANTMMTTFSQTVSDASNISKLTTEFNKVLESMLGLVTDKKKNSAGSANRERFETAGTTLISSLSTGVSSEGSRTKIENAIGKITDAAVKKLEHKETLASFKDAGVYLAEGFIRGINSMLDKVAEAGRALGNAASGGVEDSLSINSPSKVLYEDGEFSGMGFVNALTDYADKSYDAGAGLADSARMGLRKAITKVVDMFNGDIDTEPTIRPVLDLTNVESGARRLNTLFARNQAMSINVGSHNKLTEDQNGEETPKSGNVYNYTQNNYSPKALSRIDIYRQTKNQFSAMERMVEG